MACGQGKVTRRRDLLAIGIRNRCSSLNYKGLEVFKQIGVCINTHNAKLFTDAYI